jgi:hypothetical protein
MGKPRALAVEHEIAVVNEFHAVGGSECFGAGSDEVDMGALFENEAGGENGILDALDTGHATGFHATAVHEEGIELNASVGGKKTASSCVESGVILENDNGRLNSIESGASPGQDRVPGFKSAADAGFVGERVRGGNGPGATVNDENGSVRGTGCHVPIVVHSGEEAAEVTPRNWGRRIRRSDRRSTHCARFMARTPTMASKSG